jgi:hypothetical protein
VTTTHYHIRVQERIGNAWSEWFDGMTIAGERDGTTSLTGPFADQPALYGVLLRIRDLGLTLVSVERLDPAPRAGE